MCLASSSAEISENVATSILNLLSQNCTLYSGNINEQTNFALDCFQYSLNKKKQTENVLEIPIVEVAPDIDEWITSAIHFINQDSYNTINLTSNNEGKNFENTIWEALEPVFSKTLFKEPKLQHGINRKEFTDIFAYHEYGSFIIEAKDLSIINTGYERSQERRLKVTQGHVEKAIRQLTGAAKAFKRGEKIFDDRGNEIRVDRTMPPHCIALITQLEPYGNWDLIVKHLIDAWENTGAFFQVIDLGEFITLLKQSSGTPQLIDINLFERFKFFVEKKSVFISGI